MIDVIRVVAVLATLAAYLVHSARDYRLHVHVRKPSAVESLIHGVIGGGALGVAGAALWGNRVGTSYAAVVVVLAGLLDEMGFHRGIPPEEDGAHARGHMALMALLVVSVVGVNLPMEAP